MQTCDLCLTCLNRMADLFGAPLPKAMLSIGDDSGFRATLNNTGVDAAIPRYHVVVEWKQTTVAMLSPVGSTCLGDGEMFAADFLAWLPMAKASNQLTAAIAAAERTE